MRSDRVASPRGEVSLLNHARFGALKKGPPWPSCSALRFSPRPFRLSVTPKELWGPQRHAEGEGWSSHQALSDG